MSVVSVCSVFAASLLSMPSRGNVYYDDNGDILTGDDIIELCYNQQVCNTHFSKNVYASSKPVLDHEWTPLLFPELYDQFDSESACGSGSKFIDMDTCSQIHSPMTLYHAEGDVKVSYVEEQYSLKWANIRNSETPIYDSFLDNTVAFWTDDLAKYHSLWTELGADIVYLQWEVKTVLSQSKLNKNGERSGKTFYSLLTHNGDASTGSTLTQFELVSDTFSSLTQEIIDTKMITSEQRVFFDEETDYRSFSTGCETVPIGARRAVSSIDDNVEWYRKMFAASIVDPSKQIIEDSFVDYNGNTVKYAHIKLYPAEESTTVSFFERDLYDSTYGDFTVLDFENAMTDAHNENMITPFCGIDRWFDMHYGVDFDDSTTSEKVFAIMMQSGEKYTVYQEWANRSFVYMTEPNGHSVQLIFALDSEIEWLTEPQTWNSNWCPMTCTEEMASYSYGDDIAILNIDDSDVAGQSSTGDDDSDDAATIVQDNNRQKRQEAKVNDAFVSNKIRDQESKEGVINIVIGIIGVFAVLSLLVIFSLNNLQCCDRLKYQQLPE